MASLILEEIRLLKFRNLREIEMSYHPKTKDLDNLLGLEWEGGKGLRKLDLCLACGSDSELENFLIKIATDLEELVIVFEDNEVKIPPFPKLKELDSGRFG